MHYINNNRGGVFGLIGCSIIVLVLVLLCRKNREKSNFNFKLITVNSHAER